MAGFTQMKTPRHIPTVLSRQEIDRMIAAVKKIRDKAIIMLLYSAGIRLLECATIKPVHIDSDRMKVRVEQGKGKADRYTLLSHKTLAVLRDYVRAVKPANYLFEGRGDAHLSARMVGKIVTNAARAAGLSKGRHSAHVASLLCHSSDGVRYYGFMSARSRKVKLQLCRDQTGTPEPAESIVESSATSEDPEKPPVRTWAPCPVCGCKRMCVVREIKKPDPGGHLAKAA